MSSQVIQRMVQWVIQPGVVRPGRANSIHKICEVRCRRAGLPVVTQVGTHLQWRAFFEDMNVPSVLFIEENLTGIKEIELADEHAFGALSSLDDCGDLPTIPAKPAYDEGRLGMRERPQCDGIGFRNQDASLLIHDSSLSMMVGRSSRSPAPG